MAMKLIPDALGDKANAAFLATACDLAYFTQDEGAPKFQAELGLDAKLISVDNTQVYVATNDEHIVVAFRGSESPTSIDGLKDWFLTNAMNLLIVPDGEIGALLMEAGAGAKFHQGFVSAIKEIWAPFYAEVDAQLKAKDRLLWVSGHSLGGALAMLASWLLLKKTTAIHQIYTFGAPMVGNREVAAAYRKEFPGQIFRYVNGSDPVPLLPMMSLLANDFSQVDTFMPLANAPEAGNIMSFTTGLVTSAVKQVLSSEERDKVWTGVMGQISAHFMDGYRKGLS
jgi:triacylglycerol lipase